MQPAGEGWSRERVERRLIAAFRAMPACPVYGHGRRLRPVLQPEGASQVTDVLNWARLLEDDPQARLYLWSWARCQATGASFSGLVAARGWSRSGAEAGRRRGATAIAEQLAAAQKLAGDPDGPFA